MITRTRSTLGIDRGCQRALATGDEGTYSTMELLKESNRGKHPWLFPKRGHWHLLVQCAKVLLMRYWGVGIEHTMDDLGGDDKTAASGSNYGRVYFLVTAMYEALMNVVVKE